MKFGRSLQSQMLIDEYRIPLEPMSSSLRVSGANAQLKQTASITDRLLAGDKTAVRDCLDNYGDIVWNLARKYTADAVAAETATEEIFVEIWKWAAEGRMSTLPERSIIIKIAASHLALHHVLNSRHL